VTSRVRQTAAGARRVNGRRAFEAELRPGGHLCAAVSAPRAKPSRVLRTELRLGRQSPTNSSSSASRFICFTHFPFAPRGSTVLFVPRFQAHSRIVLLRIRSRRGRSRSNAIRPSPRGPVWACPSCAGLSRATRAPRLKSKPNLAVGPPSF